MTGIPTNREYALQLDASDPIGHLRSEFCIPPKSRVTKCRHHDPLASTETNTTLLSNTNSHKEESTSNECCIYLCGNSLGLQPKSTRKLLTEELNVWADCGVHGHFSHDYGRPWVSIDEQVEEASARIVGAKPSEVSILNSLTVNLHLLMVSFYSPTQDRFKILIEDHAFPSDHASVILMTYYSSYRISTL